MTQSSRGKRVVLASGVDAMTSVDVFPVRPLILSARVDAGTLYRTPMVRARATVGVMLGRFCELYAGHEYRRIGRAVLQGPQVGLRTWF